MIVVREMTRSALICERSVISASVMPSAKYSCAESLDKFVSGSTARDRIFADVVLLKSLSRSPPTFKAASAGTPPVTATTPILVMGRAASLPEGAGLLSPGS
jgi:hypothetical protein